MIEEIERTIRQHVTVWYIADRDGIDMDLAHFDLIGVDDAAQAIADLFHCQRPSKVQVTDWHAIVAKRRQEHQPDPREANLPKWVQSLLSDQRAEIDEAIVRIQELRCEMERQPGKVQAMAALVFKLNPVTYLVPCVGKTYCVMTDFESPVCECGATGDCGHIAAVEQWREWQESEE